jgi:murein DD-endopeptidase MepM/ murein hydrolase activator NlpD
MGVRLLANVYGRNANNAIGISVLILAAILLSACNTEEIAKDKELAAPALQPLQVSTQSLSTIKRISPTPTVITIPAQKTEEFKPTDNPTPEGLPTETGIAATQSSLPEVQICSPLNDFPLEKLPKIVSAPYKPPPMGSDDRHQGVDFVYHRLAGIEIPIIGVQVNAILPGYVAASLVDTFPYGSLVMVETPGSWLPAKWLDELAMTKDQSLYHLYAHLLEKPMVELGELVSSCQAIGKVGKSGNTEAAHLHLEIRIGPNGGVFPSMFGLLPEAPEDARMNYNLWRTSGIYQHFDPMFLLLELE